MPPPSPMSLQDAIQWVDNETANADSLLRLETASALVQGLAEIGDAALGYFVDKAHDDGRSWSEIGKALGMSKQGAQQKHMVRVSFGPNAPTLEHLTPRPRERGQRSSADRPELASQLRGHGTLAPRSLPRTQRHRCTGPDQLRLVADEGGVSGSRTCPSWYGADGGRSDLYAPSDHRTLRCTVVSPGDEPQLHRHRAPTPWPRGVKAWPLTYCKTVGSRRR